MERKQFVNQERISGRAVGVGGHQARPRSGQLYYAAAHRPPGMSFAVGLILFTLLPAAGLLCAQNSSSTGSGQSPAAASGSSVSATLGPALGQIGQALINLNIRHWKAPGEVKDATEGDVASIQRDLSGTLAGLLQQADANPGSVPAAFAVYRNVDALYDTLLRVVETANLAAPDQELAGLQSALSSLENARSMLGEEILNGSRAEQTELNRLRTVIAAAAAAQRAPVTTTVVNDGPVKAPEASKRKHVTRRSSASRKKANAAPASAPH